MPGSTSNGLLVCEDRALDHVGKALPKRMAADTHRDRLIPHPLHPRERVRVSVACLDLVTCLHERNIRHRRGQAPRCEVDALIAIGADRLLIEAVLEVAA